ncbi:hypothetical protein Pmani_019741 [Petrolisthes manimaculis]|uniref:Uncharacterized protein n=1 Tax=Petrolisthes manimaculis TaxID=1843537 RepID=A0AAE1PJS6_9EUCA|nr:hypothetical protein Pmani_019741 [Petrolisthes manimaculis]
MSKKVAFPPLPDPPTWEEMEEDLRKTDNSDVTFTDTLYKTDERKGTGELKRQTSHVNTETVNEKDDIQNSDQVFSEAVDFVEKNDELLTYIKLLGEEKEKLQEVSQTLKVTVEEVKKQALVAIDGY